ncbi:NADH-quinone oxidoreductase subunit A [Streptomyces sp. TRM75563]|uniref:NADH-quinone oxidoreductase subunit A n=1 Tax=Streptomyces sp. TRM75563 TaxID=2817418 RepID=UPI001F61AE8E|nr:NADH-quinone oxidoreductase subunit A [Streptomyces sp. TRM75563]MCI4044622.1 NADH-quinone oxidoreductase subunit A [Streptomyces sp. TRM75563]
MADVTDVTGVADAAGTTGVSGVSSGAGVQGLPGASGVPADGPTALASEYFQSYSVIGLLALVGVLFVAVAFGAGRLLRPVVPTPEKLLTYECGVDPVGEGWAHTQVRYYVYAFLYVIFAVDSIFLFPWATVFAAPGYGATTLVEMFIFLGFLAVGLLYAWKKGVLAWA